MKRQGLPWHSSRRAASTLVVLDLIGTLVFALSGRVAGVKEILDLFGVLVLSFAAASAGGIMRDLLIGAVPPAAISDWRYLGVSLLAGLVVFFCKLILYLPETEAAQADEIEEAFHQHFAFRRDEAEKQLKRLRRFGWRTLLIAFGFLSLTILIVEFINRLSASHLSTVIREGLTILARIALWRPGELLLYEWYPFRRDAKLFGKLEHAASHHEA